MEKLKQLRKFMKSSFSEWNDIKSDQEKKLPQPPLEKTCENYLEIIDLPKAAENVLLNTNVFDIINSRKSRRKYKEENISLEELSFLLWSTQGVKDIRGDNYATIRTVPSAGARHPFETYLIINKVDGLKKGLYRYLALNNQLALIFEDDNLEEKISKISHDQIFVGKSAVTFIWTCIPYRGEWRYYISSHKHMLLDAGHLCQNLYIASEAINCGTCAIGAYDQEEIDKLINVDGENEFVVYLAPVGKY